MQRHGRLGPSEFFTGRAKSNVSIISYNLVLCCYVGLVRGVALVLKKSRQGLNTTVYISRPYRRQGAKL